MSDQNTIEEAQQPQAEVKPKRPWWRRLLRLCFKLIFILTCLVIILILVIRSPWGQNLIVQKATQYLSEKTHTKVEIKRLFITFSGNIALEGLYLEDKQGDTLIYSKSLEAAIPILPILQGNPISIDDVQWDGLRANVVQLDTIHGFNYQFLIDAFATDSAAATAPEPVDTTASEPLQIAVGEIDFSDFKLYYHDAVSGMEARLNLGELHFEGEDLDLENMKFHIADLALRNTQISYTQSKPFPETPEDTTATLMPFLQVDHFELNQVQAHYQSIPDSMTADLAVGNFELQLPKADLQEQVIEIKKIGLSNTQVDVKMMATATEAESSTASTDQPLDIAALWPEWQVDIETLNLAQNTIKFQNGPLDNSVKGFNPDALQLHDLKVQIENFHLHKTPQFSAELKHLSFKEQSGINLEQLAVGITFDSTAVDLSDLNLVLNRNRLQGEARVSYPDFEALFNRPEKLKAQLDFPTIAIHLKDILQLMPDLKTIPYLSEVAQQPITGKLLAQGSMERLNLENLQLHWGETTRLLAQGQFVNVTDPEKLNLQLQELTFSSTRADVVNFVSEEEFGIRLPETMTLTAQAFGNMNDLKARAQLHLADSAQINLEGFYQDTDSIRFKADLIAKNIALNDILIDSTLGNLGFHVQAHGHGTSLADLTAKYEVGFSQLDYNKYDFSPLGLKGYLNKGKGETALYFDDRNMQMISIASVTLDSLSQEAQIMFNMNGADFYALKLLNDRLRARMLLTAHIKNTPDNFSFDAHVADVAAVYNKKTHHLGELDLEGFIEDDSTAVSVTSNFLNGQLQSNTNPGHLAEALGRHFKRYFSDSILPADSIVNPVRLRATMQFSENDFVQDVFLPDVHKMEPLSFYIDYDQGKNILTSTLMLPYIDYAENEIKDLQLIVTATKEAGVFVLGVNKVDAGAFAMNQTNLIGELKKGVLTLDFEGFNEQGEKFYATQTKLYGRNRELFVHTSPESILLNGVKWDMPEDNLLVLKKDSILATNIVMSHGDQKMIVGNDLEKTDQSNIGIGFKNFSLKSFLALFNPDDYLAAGKLQGNIVAENPFGNMGFIADFGIDSLQVLGADFGKFVFDAYSEGVNHYFFKTSLKGSDVDLHTKGDYLAADKPLLNFDFVIDKFGFKTIAKLSQQQLTDAEGYLSGRLSAAGQLKHLKFDGFLQFNEASFRVDQLNTTFKLTHDRVELDNDGIRFKDFVIHDENNNPFYLSGGIVTDDFTDPKLEITVKANDFQLMNSTVKDNELYYGTINLDAQGSITGRVSLPVINLDLGVNKATDFTYVMSEEQAAVEKRDGIVEFVNKLNPDDIMTRNSDTVRVSKYGNMILHAKLDVDKEAAFGVIIDPRTGDNFKISGEGNLDFRITGTNEMKLSGRYIISGGHYKMSLYNLVKREFEFVPGGSIVWQGDPLDADLDVSATYRVKTSAMGLMASQISGASEAEKNKYRQILPFIVSLTVKGTIDRPELSFGLDMPEGSRGALGGAVYGRINQLKDNEGEINKQVFSLLVMNRFFPEAGSDGSQGGIANMARNNLSQALSDQLNNFSDKLMGDTGFKLNFGVDNYTDYQGQSAQTRTDLNISAEKSLFNDRLVIKAGTEMNVQGDTRPGEENPLLGNVSIEYLLTKDGRWRITGFRKNEYENVIDGQVYVNGIGLMFQRQFNKFNELWHSFFGGETGRDEEEKTDSKQNEKATTEETTDENSSSQPQKN